jgi:hypothetical protein
VKLLFLQRKEVFIFGQFCRRKFSLWIYAAVFLLDEGISGFGPVSWGPTTLISVLQWEGCAAGRSLLSKMAYYLLSFSLRGRE